MRFPTDETPLGNRMKIQAYMPALQELGIRRPRNKYRNVAESICPTARKKEESFKDKNAQAAYDQTP